VKVHFVYYVEKLIKQLPTAPSDSSNAVGFQLMRGYFDNNSNVETESDVIEAQIIVLQISSAYGLAKHRNGQMSAGSGQWPLASLHLQDTNGFVLLV
jgi:hypothetical protein